VIQALLAAGAEVRKDGGSRILAGHEMWRVSAVQQLRGFSASPGAMGKFEIKIDATTHEGEPGKLVAVEVHKEGIGAMGKTGWAGPVLDETACLLKSLPVADPLKQPEGPLVQEASPQDEVRLPKGTEVKVRLSDVLYSKEMKPEQPIIFQVAE